MEYRCFYCDKDLKSLELAISSSSGKLFCKSEHAPLEEDSCALKYIQANLEGIKGSYYFIKLDRDKDDKTIPKT